MIKHTQKTKSSPSPSFKKGGGRRALIAKIHIGKKELGFDDDTYRDVLKRVTGKRSCSDMSVEELKAVLMDMACSGFEARAKANNKKGYGKKPDVTTRKKALMSKVEAILADMSLPWAYADGMAKNMFGVAKVQWLEVDNLYKLTQALAVYQRRQEKKQAKEQGDDC